MEGSPQFIYTSDRTAPAERQYVLRWLFEDVFGVEVVLDRSGKAGLSRLSLRGVEGHLTFPDLFLPRADQDWLGLNTVPLGVVSDLQGLPLIFQAQSEADRYPDVLGTLFFLMSRYEEAVCRKTDLHQRFPSSASVLHGFTNRAIGNEYIEWLWQRIVATWPAVEQTRKSRSFRILPSHDIDHPSGYWKGTGDWWRTFSKHLVKGRLAEAKTQVSGQLDYCRIRAQRKWSEDPFDTIDWIMEISSANNCTSTFFYIPFRTSALDPGMPLSHPHVEDQWRRIHNGGHLLGCHPGYETCYSADRIKLAADQVIARLNHLGISQVELGTRQHYLRWVTPDTASACSAAGFSYDTTLGFAEEAGFRCGLCYEYPMFDLRRREPLPLRQRPLIVMDCTVVDERYMGLGTGEAAFSYINGLKECCRKYNGDFTILWHNQRFCDANEQRLYQDVLQAI